MAGRTYEKSPYSVTVAADGKIKVKSGDWLSKYSWAIYGNYTTLNVFARWDDRQAQIKEYPIANKDLITVGETIIHYPTYEEFKRANGGNGKPEQPGSTGSQPSTSGQKLTTPIIKARLDAASWSQKDDEAQAMIAGATYQELYDLDLEGVLRLYDALTRKPGWYDATDHNAVKKLSTAMKFHKQPTPQFGVDLARAARSGVPNVQQLLTVDIINRIYAAEARRMNSVEPWIPVGTMGRGQLGQPAYQDVINNFPKELSTTLAYNYLPEMMVKAPARWNTFDWVLYKVNIPANYYSVFTEEMVEDFVVAAYLALKIQAASKAAGRTLKDVGRFAVGVYHGAYCSISHAQGRVNNNIDWAPVEQYMRTGCDCTCPPPQPPGHTHTDTCDYINEVVV